MAKVTTVLGQMLNLIPKVLFENLATQYQVDKGVRTMTAAVHLAVMLFTQFAGLPSLRRIEQATVALSPLPRQAGLIHACKSTLAEANLRIPWKFYQDLFFGLFATVKDQFPRHKFDLPGKLFSLDSTIIPLCLSLCRWALQNNKPPKEWGIESNPVPEQLSNQTPSSLQRIFGRSENLK